MPLPTARRAAFTLENIPAKTGHEAEVPPTRLSLDNSYSFSYTKKFSPAIAISGNALPSILNPGSGLSFLVVFTYAK